jgi:hypothetical protein
MRVVLFLMFMAFVLMSGRDWMADEDGASGTGASVLVRN